MAKSLDQWYRAGKKQAGVYGSVEEAWKFAKGKPKSAMSKENAKDAFTRGFYSSPGHSYTNPRRRAVARRRVANSKQFPAKAIIMPNGKVKVFVSPGVMARIKRVGNPNVRQTACRYCDLDIENEYPYKKCEWRDRGGNIKCNDGKHCHAPVLTTTRGGWRSIYS